MRYIVNVSGGLTSFEALRRTITRYGRESTVAVFADTRAEDQDLYRFLDDTERYLGIEIVRLADGRDIWEVMRDERCITMQQYAPCSKHLKRQVVDRWIATEHAGVPNTRVFGMDWTETERMDRLRAALDPIPVWFPLAEPPYVDKCHIAADLERIGIKPPRLYDLGFEHNNCGGFCVKAGQAHFARLYHTMPDRYRYHEAKEQELRDYLGKDVSVLVTRTGGVTTPITLRQFREQIERGEKYDTLDFGGCGCFAPIVQHRMDDLLLEVV